MYILEQEPAGRDATRRAMGEMKGMKLMHFLMTQGRLRFRLVVLYVLQRMEIG